jgi:membrane protein
MERLWKLMQETVQEFGQSQPAELAGAISYFAILSIAPILVVAIAVAGLVFGANTAETRIEEQVDVLLGEQVASSLEVLFTNADAVQPRGARVFGVVTLFIGATGLFAQIQRALNRIWRVRPKPKRSLLAVARGRGLGFVIALMLGVLFVLLIVVDGLIVALRDFIITQVDVPGVFLAARSAEALLSFGMLTLLFAVVFRILPDAVIKWRDVWVGAAVTALLFSLGQVGIGLYLRQTTLASAFGAAGSVIVLLLWVYFSALAFLFGAQFTRVFARQFGERIQPKPYAVRLPALDDLVESKSTTG